MALLIHENHPTKETAYLNCHNSKLRAAGKSENFLKFAATWDSPNFASLPHLTSEKQKTYSMSQWWACRWSPALVWNFSYPCWNNKALRLTEHENGRATLRGSFWRSAVDEDWVQSDACALLQEAAAAAGPPLDSTRIKDNTRLWGDFSLLCGSSSQFFSSSSIECVTFKYNTVNFRIDW